MLKLRCLIYQIAALNPGADPPPCINAASEPRARPDVDRCIRAVPGCSGQSATRKQSADAAQPSTYFRFLLHTEMHALNIAASDFKCSSVVYQRHLTVICRSKYAFHGLSVSGLNHQHAVF